MAKGNMISEEQRKEIQEARRKNKNKNVEKRLCVLELRAEGKTMREIAKLVGYHYITVGNIVAKYLENGIEAITGNHYVGNHKNMSFDEESAILAPFISRAEKGEMVDVKEMAEAYQKAVPHKVSDTQIYVVLHRHGWRKVMPRAKHPKAANEGAIEASKKLTTV